MARKLWIALLLVLSLWLFCRSEASAQNFNASLRGIVQDPSGAAVPNAEVTLKFIATDVNSHVTSGADGSYAFVNLRPGKYQLAVSAKGFGGYVQAGIELTANENAHENVQLQIGSINEVVVVRDNASPLNTTNAEIKGSITPEALKELPLLANGNIRSSAGFLVLLPGVSNGAGNDPQDSRINGGFQQGGEAIVDGVSLQQGMMSTSGVQGAVGDFPMSPDAVREVTVLTSNYDPEYGSSTSGQIIMETKSGTDQYHGSLYEYARNTAFNARPFGAATKPVDREHEFGGSIGGPVWIPKLWPKSRKTYFFMNLEGFRISGGVNANIFSVPTMQERSGDFRDWVDSNGSLVPVYDPDTTPRTQFMGCDGQTPNVICPSDPRMQNSLAPQWFQFVPAPNRPGLFNNYVSPVVRPTYFIYHTNYLNLKLDQYIGNRDHVSFSLYYLKAQPNLIHELPAQISSDQYGDPERGMYDRLNWDHTFTPNLVNHAAIGYLNWNEAIGGIDAKYGNQLPQIPGVDTHSYPPLIAIAGYTTLGSGQGPPNLNLTARPDFTANDLVTWVKGRHTLKFGGEYRWLAQNNRTGYSSSGGFSFSNTETGLQGINSGSPIASFLLGQVDSGSATFRSAYRNYSRGSAYILHAGDTWRLTPKLTVDYGLRWDVHTPAVEKYDRQSFFDPTRPNPEAGGLPGSLVFAGTRWGAASFGRRAPERTWYKGFEPRFGLAYNVTPKTVVRAGYGIFIAQMFYPGWGGGIAQDGFQASPSFSSTNAGMTAAFLLQNGLPQNFARPPSINLGQLNGTGSPSYRPFDSNRRPYSQQWNLTIERQVTTNLYFDVAYVGNKGTRLPSQIDPLNALDPKYLSLGNKLNDQFGPSDAVVDGVPAPYPGWATQMQACAPSVAQALEPFPQYCGSIIGLTENKGDSTYHSFQVKVENRLSHGLWLLASYTNSKTLTDSDIAQAPSALGTGLHGVISPFQSKRNKGLAVDDVPQTLSLALAYQFPFGKGRHWGAELPRVLNAFVGGWSMSSIFRATSGPPFFFRSAYCNVPGQFAAGCLPAILPGANPLAQDRSHFDPNKPLFNVNAFEDFNSFNFYLGQGSRVSNVRGFGYHNHDMVFTKEIPISEKVKLQFSGQFFNIWNWHSFNSSFVAAYTDSSAFDTTVGSPTFGMWNGKVSNPRYIQLAGRVTF